MMLERVPPARPLTARQAQVVEMASRGLTYYAIGRLLGCSDEAVRALVQKVASRLPGDLPPRERCIVWWRGANVAVLMGLPVREL